MTSPSPAQAAVELLDLHKAFGPIEAVGGVTLQVAAGEVFSLLGPNGAGKTTTLSMLCGLVRPDRGEARICGHSIREEPLVAKAQLGVVPQDLALYEDLTARENLHFFGQMYGLKGARLKTRIDAVLELIGLTERAKERVGKYSGGMKRRLNIGVALLHEPRVVIMDEPTVGIDPQSRRHILDGVSALNAAGMTVLYTTHYMEEAQALSHRVAIMDQGRVIAEGTVDELIRLVGSHARIELKVSGEREATARRWRDLDDVAQVDLDDERVLVLSADPDRVLPRLFETAVQAGGSVGAATVTEPDLEAVFLHLTGKALRD